MINVVAYARYSSDNQREESIDAQLRAIRDFCDKEGFNLVQEYTDYALSGRSDERPAFLNMVEDSEKNLFSYVIVHKLDRFSRDKYDSIIYKKKLKDNNVRVVSVLEKLDDTPESIILESLLEGLAQYYSANLAREVMKGMLENAHECKYTGGYIPLGYSVDKNTMKFVINQDEAKIVKEIFSLYLNGMGYSRIATSLNERNLKTRMNKDYTSTSIKAILENKKYMGTYIYNATRREKIHGKQVNVRKKDEDMIVIENGIDAIIEKEVFEMAQNKMNNNIKKRKGDNAKELYLLTGLIKCAECNGAMVGNTRRRSKEDPQTYKYYECNNRKRLKNCKSKSVDKYITENKVLDALKKEVLSESGIDNVVMKLEEYCKLTINDAPNDIKKYKKELNAVQKQIDSLIDAIANGMYHESMNERLTILEKQKQVIACRINEAEHQMELANIPNKTNILKYLKKDLEVQNMTPESQKRVIATYIEEILIYHDHMQIAFAVPIQNPHNKLKVYCGDYMSADEGT